MEKTFAVRRTPDYLEIGVLNYAYPEANDAYDKNWLNVIIQVKAGAFSGKFDAYFQTADFIGLWHQLKELYNDLGKQFKFSTLEDQLTMDFTGDELGHININVRAQDQAGVGNILEFDLNIDQTDVKVLIDQLNEIIREYPFK